MFDIKTKTKEILEGSIIDSGTGVNLYTPDGKRDYPALWTRDFAYMVEYARDLIPDEDIEKAIEYILDGAKADGWIPDRVYTKCNPVYTAGDDSFPALPNLDNGCFIILCANSYLKTIDENKAKELFLKWKDALCKGIDCLPKSDKGFILNDSNPPHSPYGFTDTVSKGGELAFESLLLWRAEKELSFWLETVGLPNDKYLQAALNIENNFVDTFLQDNGMFKAATEVCAQTDIWCSCYAVSIGFPISQEIQKGIYKWIADNYDKVVYCGQLRQLPIGEYWERTFVYVKEETYQNGAFWATPIVWLYDTLKNYNLQLAKQTFEDILDYFEKFGIFECVNGENRKLDTYVASATNVYGLFKQISNE